MTTWNKTELIQQVKHVLDYNTKTSCEHVSELIDIWEKNKEDFIEMFHGNLIYETEIPLTFYLQEKDKKTMYQSFLDWLDANYTWLNMEDADLGALYDFISSAGVDDFFDNKTSKDIKIIKWTDKNKSEVTEEVIPSHSKLVKNFKRFIQDKQLLRKIQDRASEFIQKEKIEGYLCFSVHPLDYLSISENTLNWRSCHALDGDYCAGNLQYMIDHSTVVCYLKGDKETYIPRFNGIPWNNKKWRMLLFFNETQDMILAGRQYPFDITTSLSVIHDNLSSNVLKYPEWLFRWSEWTNKNLSSIKDPTANPSLKGTDILLSKKYYYVGGSEPLMTLDKLIVEPKNSLFYNDLLNSHFYTDPYYMIKRPIHPINRERAKFFIGGQVRCPCCGKNILKNPGELICAECINKAADTSLTDIFCSVCDRRIEDNEWYAEDGNGEPICSECVNDFTTVCNRCGKIYLTSKMTYLNKNFYCCDCINEIQEEGE